jgi:LysM repeat protein
VVTPQPTLAALTPPPPTAAATSSAKPGASSGPNASVVPAPSVGSSTATANRLELLTPCAGQADCYVYVVRSGDNLFSIAAFFGVDLGRVRDLNDWIGADSLIRPRQHLVIPTPTR